MSKSSQEDPAPLWRPRANCARHVPPSQRHSVIGSETSMQALEAFQQSLRVYAPPRGFNNNSACKKNLARNKKPASRNYITNLESEQSTPFFLDYLNQQAATMDPMASGNIFDHRKFMNMFQGDKKNIHISSGATADVGNSFVSSEGGESFGPTSIENAPREPKSNVAFTKIVAPKEFASHNLRQPREGIMERSSNTLTERLQSAAERRALIESAKIERLSRSNTSAQQQQSSAMFASTIQNPSLAFGSTRPRNIDLNRPLVTPLRPAVRPRSEILPQDFNAMAQAKKEDSMSRSIWPTESQQHNRQALQQLPKPQSAMTQSTSCQSFQSFQQQQRAARRHDPELMPVVQKYIFREYAAPGSLSSHAHSGGIRKEQSSMSASMTRSFQVGHSAGSRFGAQNTQMFGNHNNTKDANKPKKSFSMNRLDQLAQPRRRVEPKIPNSSSFLRSRGNEGQQPAIAKKPTEIHGSSSATTKPVPPQKNLEKLTPKINTNGPNRPSTTMARTPKPRPLSHYEPLDSSTSTTKKALDANVPVVEEEKGTPEEENEKLAAYKNALAEKRALFRKRQEEQKAKQEEQAQPAPRAKIVKPQIVATASSSSSSSSSASSSDSEDEKTINLNNKKVEVEVSLTDSLETEQVNKSVEAKDEPEAAETEANPPATNNLMTTSCDPSLLAAAIGGNNNNNEKTLEPTNSVVNNVRSTPSVISDEKARIERMMRKNRVQDILNRTVRSDKRNSNGASSGNKLNGTDTVSSEESATENETTTNGVNGKVNGQTNGHGHEEANGNHDTAQLNGNGFKAFGHPLESLPSTNGF